MRWVKQSIGNDIYMIEEVMALIFLPLLVGSTIGSMYFLVSSVGKHSWVVLGVLFIVSWFLGYASGLPFAQTMYAMLVSLFGSAMAVSILDSTKKSVNEDKEVPKILKWIVELINSLRGGGRGV